VKNKTPTNTTRSREQGFTLCCSRRRIDGERFLFLSDASVWAVDNVALCASVRHSRHETPILQTLSTTVRVLHALLACSPVGDELCMW